VIRLCIRFCRREKKKGEGRWKGGLEEIVVCDEAVAGVA